MAIAPIDLQTLFTQLDKVGRAHLTQREGQAIQQAVQSVMLQRKTDEHIQQVNEAQNTGEGAQKINDHGQREHGGSRKKERGQKEESEIEDEDALPVLRDPSLGKTIDISL
jgi:hypothetical protein